MFKISSAFLLLLSSGFAAGQDSNVLIGGDQDESSFLLVNLVNRCAIDFDPSSNIDYFPTKYAKPSIKSYGDIDIFGEKFIPHNTTDFLEITYHRTYKIVTNKHQDPPVSYLLYQCGTEIPQDVVDANDFKLVMPVPHQGGLAITQTPQIPYIELLGLREQVIALIGDPKFVTSPCMSHMLSEDATPGRGTTIETIYDSNSTIQLANIEDFRERHPDAIIIAGPNQNVVGEQVIVTSTTQERTNVATFDWIHFYATFFNMEGEANRIATKMQDSYDCSSDVARDIADQQRKLPEFKEPVVMWAKYFTYQDLGWSVGDCPTWDSVYYCEYAEHCGATILSRPEGMGYSKTWGSPTVFWYISDEEVLEMGKDADIFVYSGDNWDSIYELKKEVLDQFKAVQNKQVFDTLGQGASAWLEQRYAEYDVVGLDMCDIVGHSSETGPKHERRWLRNVFTDPVGTLDVCDVAGGEISKPFVPPGQECVRPQNKLPVPPVPTTADEGEEDVEEVSSSAASSMTGLVFAMITIAYAVSL